MDSVPLQHHGGFGAVDAEGLIRYSGFLIGYPSEKPHGPRVERLQQKPVRAGRGLAADEARSRFAIGRELLQALVVIVKRQPAAARLLQIVDLQAIALGLEEDRLARARGSNADAAQPEEAIAGGRAQTGGLPTGGSTTARIESPVAEKGCPASEKPEPPSPKRSRKWSRRPPVHSSAAVWESPKWMMWTGILVRLSSSKTGTSAAGRSTGDCAESSRYCATRSKAAARMAAVTLGAARTGVRFFFVVAAWNAEGVMASAHSRTTA